MNVADVLFVLFIGIAAYPYVGYPVLLYLFTMRRRDPVPPPESELPSVTLITVAFNEEEVIAEKVANLNALQYPEDRLKVVIASDGSTDDTIAVARSVDHGGRIDFRDIHTRRGKATVLDELVQEADTDVVVLSDANTFYDPEAVLRLVRWFSDPRVGAVCGEMTLVASPGHAENEASYWNYEALLKRLENRIGAVLGANGGIYAFRKAVYVPIPHDTITDDFLLPMLIRKQGYRIIYDADARAQEEIAPAIRHEFRRRVRIGTGNLQALARTLSLLLPRSGWTAFSYWSHKVARWASPLFLTLAVLVVVTQLQRPFYLLVGVACGLATLVAGFGWALESRGKAPPKLLASIYYFVALNLAILIGTGRYLKGSGSAVWARTPRT
jgi:cellulose synthase/poly-beta-1,6-N-acetylglucosamine synthase-like glycosyltransferase